MKAFSGPARYSVLTLLLGAALAVAGFLLRGAGAAPPTVTVYKTASCGCCGAWVEHLRAAGVATQVHDVADLVAVKARLGVAAPLASCHTTTIGGYVIEGHVPAVDIQRLLGQRPAGVGLAVPGMPAGSPGTESGDRHDPYEVLLWGDRRAATVFAEHGRAGRQGS
jgi:hypothetical protein